MTIDLDSTNLTIDDIRAAATRPSENATHCEITLATDSPLSMPLPTDDGSVFVGGTGGDFRYLFHDQGLIEVEYTNAEGTLREAHLNGTMIAHSFTPKGA
jgi:hypothetical protein